MFFPTMWLPYADSRKLDIPGAYVVQDRVADNVIVGGRPGYVAASPADHDGQLDLPVQFGGDMGQRDRIIGPDDR